MPNRKDQPPPDLRYFTRKAAVTSGWRNELLSRDEYLLFLTWHLMAVPAPDFFGDVRLASGARHRTVLRRRCKLCHRCGNAQANRIKYQAPTPSRSDRRRKALEPEYADWRATGFALVIAELASLAFLSRRPLGFRRLPRRPSVGRTQNG